MFRKPALSSKKTTSKHDSRINKLSSKSLKEEKSFSTKSERLTKKTEISTSKILKDGLDSAGTRSSKVSYENNLITSFNGSTKTNTTKINGRSLLSKTDTVPKVTNNKKELCAESRTINNVTLKNSNLSRPSSGIVPRTNVNKIVSFLILINYFLKTT